MLIVQVFPRIKIEYKEMLVCFFSPFILFAFQINFETRIDFFPISDNLGRKLFTFRLKIQFHKILEKKKL